MIIVMLVLCIFMMLEIFIECMFVRFVIEVIEYIFVVVMSLEFGVKIFVNGLIFIFYVVI